MKRSSLKVRKDIAMNYKVYLNKLQNISWSIVRFVIIVGLCYIILYPFIVKISNSIKSYSDFFDPTVRFIAKNPTLDNIITTFQGMDYFSSAFNTAILSLICGILQTAICAIIAYGFAKFRFKGNSFLFFFVLLTLLIPPQTIMIPFFLKFRFLFGIRELSTIDTIFPMIAVSLTGMGLKNGLYIFMLRQVFRGMPKELEEAAYIDGCGYFKTFYKIMLLSAIPTLTTVFLFIFSWQWADTFYNNLFFVNYEVLTISMTKIIGLSNEPIIQSMYLNTAAILAILPLAVLYIFTQKVFVQSVERSGLVG